MQDSKISRSALKQVSLTDVDKISAIQDAISPQLLYPSSRLQNVPFVWMTWNPQASQSSYFSAPFIRIYDFKEEKLTPPLALFVPAS